MGPARRGSACPPARPCPRRRRRRRSAPSGRGRRRYRPRPRGPPLPRPHPVLRLRLRGAHRGEAPGPRGGAAGVECVLPVQHMVFEAPSVAARPPAFFFCFLDVFIERVHVVPLGHLLGVPQTDSLRRPGNGAEVSARREGTSVGKGKTRAPNARDGGSAPFDASSDDRAVSPRSGAPFDAVDARRRRRTRHGTRGCGGCSFERRRRPQTNVIPRSWPSSARFAGSDDPREFRLARCAARKERLGWVPGFGHAPALPVGLLTTREPPRIRDVRTKSLRSTTPLKCARPRGVCAPPAGHTPAKSRARGKTKKPRLPRCEPFAELVNRGFNFPRPSAARVPQCE